MTKRKECREGCGRPVEKEGRTSRCRTCRRNAKKRDVSVERPGGPRVLLVDIETSLQLSYHFGQWGVNINPELTVAPTRMLCFAAKWLGDQHTMFQSEWRDGRQAMVETAWGLLNEADVVVHYYGSRFDVPHLNREFLQAGLTPPSPYKQVDLKLAVSKRFKFDSNKLEFVSRICGEDGGKLKHEGAMLWRKVQEGDSAAQKRMEAYNRRDTELLEEVYERLLPWIPNVPHRHLYDGHGCPNCGGESVNADGTYMTALSRYVRYVCSDCGSWFRGTKRLGGVSVQAAVLS